MLYSHEQLYIHICMQKHNDAIKTSGHSSLEKYTLYSKVRKGYERFYCVRGELETEQNCNRLSPTLLAMAVFLSRSPGLLNRGPEWFSFQHLLSNCLTSCLHPGYIIVCRPPSFKRHKSHLIQPVHCQGYILIFLDRMYLLFTQEHFLFWQLGRVGGQYATLILIILFNDNHLFVLNYIVLRIPIQ